MKHFTPELYQRFNSFDPEEAERADHAWDVAEAAYEERLRKLRDIMPSDVAKLSEACFHDAGVLSREESIQSATRFFDGPFPYPGFFPLWSAVGIISLKQDNEVVTLLYCLSDHLTSKDSPEGWRFSKVKEEWLYDEVDLLGESRGPWVHRILLSSGVVLIVPFVSVVIHKVAIPLSVGAGNTKQTA